jgi:hypothetical protein
MATKAHVDIDDAFGILEAYAVATGSSVVAVAQDVVDRVVMWQDGALRPA